MGWLYLKDIRSERKSVEESYFHWSRYLNIVFLFEKNKIDRKYLIQVSDTFRSFTFEKKKKKKKSQNFDELFVFYTYHSLQQTLKHFLFNFFSTSSLDLVF